LPALWISGWHTWLIGIEAGLSASVGVSDQCRFETKRSKLIFGFTTGRGATTCGEGFLQIIEFNANLAEAIF
jgi:hypothetical protein